MMYGGGGEGPMGLCRWGKWRVKEKIQAPIYLMIPFQAVDRKIT